jgi:hypothetical protein
MPGKGGTGNLELGTRGKSGTRNPEPGTRNMEKQEDVA